MEDVPMLDSEHLSMLRELEAGDGSGKLARMFQLYLDSVPPQLARMRAALASADAATLAREAHGLAGSSSMYGMPRLRQCCVHLETHLRVRTLEGAGELVAAVERTFTEAWPLLLAELSLSGGWTPPRE